MGVLCCSDFFYLTLFARGCLHLFLAVFAAIDLNDLRTIRGLNKLLVEKDLTIIDARVVAGPFPFIFYIICAVALLVLFYWHPSRKATYKDGVHAPGASLDRVIIYGVMHILYVVFAVYVFYIRGLENLDFVRTVYSWVRNPYYPPISLVLDVLTISTACNSGMVKQPEPIVLNFSLTARDPEEPLNPKPI